MNKYFHELTEEEYEALKNSGATWADVMANYKQPDWCDYPDALEGVMGCWSLIYRKPVSETYCKDCECFKAQ